MRGDGAPAGAAGGADVAVFGDELVGFGPAGLLEVGLQVVEAVKCFGELGFGEAVGDVAGRRGGEQGVEFVVGQPGQGVAGGGVGQEVGVFGDLCRRRCASRSV